MLEILWFKLSLGPTITFNICILKSVKPSFYVVFFKNSVIYFKGRVTKRDGQTKRDSPSAVHSPKWP